MNKRILTLCLALALCLSLVPATVFAGAPLKTYTELPTGVKATNISMMGNGFGSFKTLDENGMIVSKGVIAPNGNVILTRTPGLYEGMVAGEGVTDTHYVAAGDMIADLQLVDLPATDVPMDAHDMKFYTNEGEEAGSVLDLVRKYENYAAEDWLTIERVYFGRDGYLTAHVDNLGVTNAYIIDVKTLQIKQKLWMDDNSASFESPSAWYSSVNDGLIGYNKSHGVWEESVPVTVYDAAGWIDINGTHKLSVDTQVYGDWWNFASGRAMVWSQSNNHYGYFDKTGKLVIPCIYREASMFKDGYAYAANPDGRYGYIDVDGKTVIPFQYDRAYGYGDGLFTVGYAGQYDYKYGMVDKNNNEVVPCIYDDISYAREGVAYAVKDGEICTLMFKDDPEAAKDVTNVFTDVPDNAWYAKFLQNAYDNGIVGGTSADKYSPNSNLTHAQIMVMVANLHSLQKGDNYDFQANKKAGDAWYQVFEDYCVAEGIIPAETFTDPGLFKGQENANVNRGQMAFYFAHALTDDSYADKKAVALNDISGHVFAADIEKLAKADIVGGYSDGTFKPGNLVTRAEASVFVSNILDAIE